MRDVTRAIYKKIHHERKYDDIEVQGTCTIQMARTHQATGIFETFSCILRKLENMVLQIRGVEIDCS